MARYVATIETHYKQPIPYHFTCNYCGEVNQKTFEITVSLNASGSARNVSGVQQLAGQQHEKQVRKAVREKNRAIEKYRKKLSMGKVAKGKLAYIPLKSDCEYCSKCQMWNPAIPKKEYTAKAANVLEGIGILAGGVGFIGAFFTYFFLYAQGVDLSLAVPCTLASVMLVGIVLAVIGGRINDSREAAWFREHLANDPNAPDKLPVIDK